MSKFKINPKIKEKLEEIRDKMQEKAFTSPFFAAETRQAAIYSGEYSTMIPFTKHESIGIVLVVSTVSEKDERLRWGVCGCVVSNATSKAKSRALWNNRERSIIEETLKFFLENFEDLAPGEFQKFARELHFYRFLSVEQGFELLNQSKQKADNSEPAETESASATANAL